VQLPGRDAEGSPGSEFGSLSTFELDTEQPVQDEEELILLVVLVPVNLALHDPQPHQYIAGLDTRLVVPGVAGSLDQLLHIHRLLVVNSGRKWMA
jgi:hypothetical protein